MRLLVRADRAAEIEAQAASAGWDESARGLLTEAMRNGTVTDETLPEVLAIAQVVRDLMGTRESGSIPLQEALSFGSFAGLQAAAQGDEPERARVILDQLGEAATESPEPEPEPLQVVFTDRASATKFAIAAEFLLGDDRQLRVSPLANGKYAVAATLPERDIYGIQTLLRRGVPLDEITREAVEQARRPRLLVSKAFRRPRLVVSR